MVATNSAGRRAKLDGRLFVLSFHGRFTPAARLEKLPLTRMPGGRQQKLGFLVKISAIQSLRRKLASDTPVFGLWVTLESASVTEMAVGLGLDWVVIDAEHGQLDWKEIVEHLRATVRSDTVALVRIAELNAGTIKRALDLGADGIVVPWIESRQQLEQAVAFARYPTEGVRGIGAERATCWGQALVEHTEHANDHVLVVPILETVKAWQNIQEISAVPGVELVYFGPADFSSSAGHRGAWEGPGVAEKIVDMKDLLRAAGKQCGVITTSLEDLARRQDQGFRMLGLGMDAGLLLRSLRASLAFVGRDHGMQTSLAPRTASPKSILAAPPESFRPDRSESMTAPADVEAIEISVGVRFQGLVGGNRLARNLTTGIVTFAPGAVLPYHTHPFSESVTLLEGSAEIAVEGRTYLLQKLDNVVLRRGLPHSVRNLSRTQPARFHIAMASDQPTRILVDDSFAVRPMPTATFGVAGAERVNRFTTSLRGSAGPNTEFIDFFNDELIPGLEMSGGYGIFYPGGRLPAHLHDFDESICIITGQATCMVEGRSYELAGCTTAFVPRGRVHYFINNTKNTMEMLWVYAGPKPERILVDEACATEKGNPWK